MKRHLKKEIDKLSILSSSLTIECVDPVTKEEARSLKKLAEYIKLRVQRLIAGILKYKKDNFSYPKFVLIDSSGNSDIDRLYLEAINMALDKLNIPTLLILNDLVNE